MKPIELKPCPFCGSKAELREHWGDCSKRPSWYQVECTDLDCGTCQDTAQEAVDFWNKRPPAAEVERLVKAAQNIVKAWDATYPNSGCFTLELKAALAAFEGR